MTTEPTKVDYKATICLPQTGFPMRANLNQREPEILARWKEQGLQKRLAEKDSPRGPFILHDGPPYANGPIHLGHALNKILKDVLVRHRTMAGYRAPYVPGWDCHGLPIEQKVSSELGKKKAGMSVLEIRKLCAEYARKWVKVQGEAFERLGIGGEWDRPYLTLDPAFEVGELETLKKLVSDGYVYKGLKPVFWCASCQTALADAEVEYADHTSPSIYVKFPLIAPEKNTPTADLRRPSVVIWTTTPWTLPANLAVSLHPDFEYVAIRVPAIGESGEEEDYILAKELLPAFTTAAGIASYSVVKQVRSRDLENMEMEHPVQPDRTSRVILGEHVTLEAGTGAVHTAPGHGMDDFIVGKAYGLEPVVPVDHAGRFTGEFALMEGMPIWEANGPIVRYLDEKNLLVKHEPYKHSYPHCWRCHNPIIYRATEQWFMNVDHADLRQRTLAEIDSKVEWIPSWGRDRIHNMMAARPDWCLSRQRVWGVPIPAVMCTGCRSASLTPELIENFQAVVARRGSDAWWEEPVSTFLPAGFKCGECGGTEFEKEANILDVWFDSGASHEAVLNRGTWPELQWPADLYLEGSDQHRGWFHTSLLTSMGTRGAAPYKAVLTHGFALDAKGEAMSKSKGNVIAPADTSKKDGADVLRLWVASEDYRGDVKLGEEILTRVAESYRRIRNTLRYLLGNVTGFDPIADAVPYDQLQEIDRWILHKLAVFNKAVLKAYEEYEFHRIYHLANQFCVVQLSAVYLDITKDRMYCAGPKSVERRAAQTAQYAVVDNLLRLLAPVLVYTCDEAYQYLDTASPSVHLLPFNALPAQWEQPELEARWEELLAVRDDVLRGLEDARQVKKAIGQSLEAKVIVSPSDPKLRDLLSAAEANLPELFITSQAEVAAADASAPAEQISVVQGQKAQVAVLPAHGSKCERCWRILPDVGAEATHPGLCNRCVDVLRRHF